MTALGADAPNVAGLVYVAAFGIDQGESIGGLLASGPVSPALEHMITDKQGFGWLSEDDFVRQFAGDVEPAAAKVMYAVQQPLALSAFGDVMDVPACKSQPTWYLVAQNDEAIPPDAKRQFAERMGATTVEIASGHVAMVSHPDAVADLIKSAASSVASRRLAEAGRAAVEDQRVRVDVAGFAGQQPHRGVGHLPGRRLPAKRQATRGAAGVEP
jgi:pimeloyl-ACP methyl ester carboxylesterase